MWQATRTARAAPCESYCYTQQLGTARNWRDCPFVTPEFKSRIGVLYVMVRTFAVIGDPIDHSLSPHIHNAAFLDLGMDDSSYIAYRIRRGELEQGIEALLKINISGFNVTIPHKVDVMKYLDRVDEVCSFVGAANTVECLPGGMLKGYNTDVAGFADPIHERQIDLRGAKVLLLGAGGAARAVVAALAREKVGSVMIANRTVQPAESLARLARTAGIGGADAVGLDEADSHARSSDMIVNATSMGLASVTAKVHDGIISAESINRETIVYDIVYMPMRTALIQRAKKRDATCILGYEMLLGQAVKAFEIWHPRTAAPRNAMKRVLLGGVR